MTCPACEEMDQCARCGSSVGWEDCQTCPATGWYTENDPRCPACQGSGVSRFCLSAYDWCIENPLPGREDVERSTVEWFTVPCPDCVEGVAEVEVPGSQDGAS